MSGSTSVPTIALTDRGYVPPAESDIVTGLDADYNAAFGGNLNTSASTPTGQLISTEAALIGDLYDQETLLFNNVDPAYASGRMQDAIARIYFLERNPAQSTVLQIVCTGLGGVVIPVGALIADTTGTLYLCTDLTVIPAGGTITIPFAAQVTGPLPVPASVAIYQAIPGWNTVAVDSGVVGNLEEGRAAFETRREAAVAANGAGFLPAIAGAVVKVAGVIDYYVTENYTGSPVTIGGVTVDANSLYVCVAGGLSQDIGNAIWTKKNPGCAYTGNTSVTVIDSNSGYSAPQPSYTVTFERPTDEATCFKVTLANNPGIPSNATTLIQQALLAAFNGQDGGSRARIGATLFASRFYGPVALLGSWAQIVSIKVGSNSATGSAFTGVIAGTALTTSSASGTIAIGQFVFGANVAAGTYIVSGSGSSWVISLSQTVSSSPMTGVAAASDDFTMDINQIPTFVAANAVVVAV